MWWHHLLGFVFSTAAGWFCIGRLSDALWKGMGWSGSPDEFRPHPEHSQMVGLVERALYTASWLVYQPGFIAVWLALKVAGQWSHWSQTHTVGGRRISGRAVFNAFLIGNAFSVAFGVTGGLIVEWLEYHRFFPAIFVPVALVVACWLLEIRARKGAV